MHEISLMMVKETEGVVEALVQTNKYEKQTQLKKVLKNVIEITAGGEDSTQILKTNFNKNIIDLL